MALAAHWPFIYSGDTISTYTEEISKSKWKIVMKFTGHSHYSQRMYPTRLDSECTNLRSNSQLFTQDLYCNDICGHSWSTEDEHYWLHQPIDLLWLLPWGLRFLLCHFILFIYYRLPSNWLNTLTPTRKLTSPEEPPLANRSSLYTTW